MHADSHHDGCLGAPSPLDESVIQPPTPGLNPNFPTLQPFIPIGTAGITQVEDFTFAPDGSLFVTADTTTGPELMLFNGTTGAFIQNLSPLPKFNDSNGGYLVTYVTPEPSLVGLPVIGLLFARKRRRAIGSERGAGSLPENHKSRKRGFHCVRRADWNLLV